MNLRDPESCAQFGAVLPLLAGDDLEPEALELARRHVASCGACALALGEARAARAALGLLQTRDDAVAPDVWPSVRAILRQEGLIRVPGEPATKIAAAHAPAPIAQAPARRVHAPRTWVRVAAAAALVAFVLTGALLRERGEDSARPEERRSPIAHNLQEVGPSAAELLPGDPLGGLRLVANGHTARVIQPTFVGMGGTLEPDCVGDPWEGQPGPRALRPSTDQVPRATSYFPPDGWSGEAIDLRQPRGPVYPFAGRLEGGVRAAGGQR